MSPLFGCAFRAVQVLPGMAMLLVNDARGSTKALVCYEGDVAIRYLRQPREKRWERWLREL